MLHLPVAAAFEQVAEAHEVGLDVAFGIDEAVTHARLCREVHDMRERVADEYGFQRGVVGDVKPEDVKAKYESGVLTVLIPKEEPKKLTSSSKIAIE